MQNYATGKFLPRLTFQTLLFMRLLTVFILAASLQVHANVSAQTVTYSAKNASIEKVFKEIKRQTGYGFMYDSRILEVAKPVTIEANKTDIKEVLDACFKNQPFTYEINDKTVIVKERVEQSKKDISGNVVTPVPLINVHGKVTDSVGSPLAGASVKVKGSSNKGTITDENGEFVLKQINNDAVLVIEFVGYGTREYSVGNQTEITASLRVTNKELAEVAIQSYSTGYQTIPKERAAGSFVQINNELFNRRVSTDFISRLEGIAPGMLFTRNVGNNNGYNLGNGSADVSIRGRSTLFSNANPLVVVDNFPYDGDLNNINPNDIENITLLKDANAASIWGVQSGNGVIVITTKKGKRNRPMQVDVNSNVTFGAKPDLYSSRAFINSSDFIDIEKSLFSQGYYDARLSDPNHASYSPVVQILADQRAGIISASDANTKIEALKGNDIRSDLSKYYYQVAINQQNAVSLSGGSEKSDYYFSAGYDNNRSNLVGNNSNRITINANNNFYLLKNLTLSTGYTFTQAKSSNNNTQSDVSVGGSGVGGLILSGKIYPYAKLVDPQGNHLSIVKNFSSVWLNDPIAQAGRMNWIYNPLNELALSDKGSGSLDNKINVGLKYSFLQMFNIDLKYQYETAESNSYVYYTDSSYYARDIYNRFYNPTGTIKTPVPPGGIFSKSINTMTSNRGRAQIGFNRTFGALHNVSAIAGAEINQIKGNSENPNTLYGYNNSTRLSIPVDFINTFPVFPSGSTGQIPNNFQSSGSIYRYLSYFANGSYTYNKRYTISTSGRIDKSNLFGVSANQKSVPLYSFGGAWDISQEKFYHIKWLPFLKLRATYGYNGNVNQGVSAVPTIAYSNTSNYFFPTLPIAFLNSNANPLLRWERIRITNFGVDFNSFNSRLSGTIEYYQKVGFDIFGTTPVAPSTGATTFTGNTANIKGHGLDISLNFVPVKTAQFTWQSNLLFSKEVSVVSKYLQKATAASLLGASSAVTISPFEGKPVFAIYSYRFGGLTHDTGLPQGYIGGKLSTDYNTIISKATPDSLVYNGSARPTIYGSWRNTFAYKGLSVSFNITYKFDYYFKKSSIGYNGLFSAWATNSDFYRRWQKPGDEVFTNVPAMPSTITTLNSSMDQFYTNSSALVDKGDHIRLQDITISYDFSNYSMGKVFKKLRLYSYINNVGILWRANKDKIDPDVYQDVFSIPRSIAVGIQATF